MFQSLFSWMLLWKYIWRHKVRLGHFVSILVLLDVALKDSIVVLLASCACQFQSLFSWMLLWKLIRFRLLGISYLRFNPCSLGCCSERVIIVNVVWNVLKFQSLFSWMLLWKMIIKARGVVPRAMFQSLFSWMLLWKRFWSNTFQKKTEFQSLFSWMLLWKRNEAFSLSCCIVVSILVLLDVALKEQLGLGTVTSTTSFNPCSLGCCSERIRRRSSNDRRFMFQSLFSWMLLWKFCTR